MRKSRVRAKFSGNALRPRLAVFRSNRGFFAQIIDDDAGKTIVGMNNRKMPSAKKGKKTDMAKEFGRGFAGMAKEKKISKVVFDRRHYAYHGRVKAFAEGAREGGLIF